MVVWALFVVVLIIVSLNDFLFFRIENEYVLSLMILYIVASIFGILGNNLSETIIVAVCVLLVSIILNYYNLLGGGDVKLLFPLILLAENHLFAFLCGTSAGGLVVAVIYFFAGRKLFFFRRKIILSLNNLYKNRNKSILLNFTLLSFHRMKRKDIELDQTVFNSVRQEIPYGIALACGGFCVVVENLVAR
ncbi:MAG: prepilin peptidase [Alphaproteobacteria bacterium]|nr:prepilin peptidase [Alphaproteobacteria bacterium]